MDTTTETAFQEETLRGDVQDRILDDIVRRMPCWTKMSEHEQRTIIDSANSIGALVVREAVKLVAHRDFPHMIVSLGKWTVKEGIKLELTASDSVEEITKLASNGGKQAILVFASVSGFMGTRGEPQAAKDQPDLPMHDPETGEVVQEEPDTENPLPETGELPEPPAPDDNASDEPVADAKEPPASGLKRWRRRAMADA